MSKTGGTTANWKSTPLGKITRYIGSVRFAVPALALAAGSMIYGTWVESTQSRAAAAEIVYGSWWFVLLMTMICASLVLSVAVRYPWKRKHTGFIIVHASLISLIAIGFYTMRTKIEGQVVLAEGEASSIATLEDQWVELVSPTSSAVLARHRLTTDKPIRFDTDGYQDLQIKIVDQWDNSAEVTRVTNDGPRPFHAVEITGGPGAWDADEGDWIGEIADTTPSIPSELAPFGVRVVPAGEEWPPAERPRAVLVDGDGNEYRLDAVGEPIGQTGWTLTSVQQFERATVRQEVGLIELESGPANPAARVVLTNADGVTEQQISFEKVRTEPFVVSAPDAAPSGIELRYQGPSFTGPTLAILRDTEGTVSAILAAPDEGTIERFENDGQWPWHLTVMDTPVSILRDFDHARASNVREKVPQQESNTPVLVVATDDGVGHLLWRQPIPVRIDGKDLVLRYGPVMVQLPFQLALQDFRKMDYPGVDMAMAFESDVRVTPLGRNAEGRVTFAEPFDFKIHMNHPYKQDGWKVYQASFMGDTITVLQVTRDPGLIPMYVACSTLCIGILLIFYSRKLSFGHPGIPAPFGTSGTKSEPGQQETRQTGTGQPQARPDQNATTLDARN